MPMTENNTTKTDVNVAEYLNAVEPAGRRSDALLLDKLFRDVTGFEPRMWGPTIVGYGQYHYVYASGRTGDTLATGFAPRKANMVLYIMPGYSDYSSILADLGKYKIGKSCLYLGALKNVNLDVLATLIGTGVTDLDKKWPVTPS